MSTCLLDTYMSSSSLSLLLSLLLFAVCFIYTALIGLQELVKPSKLPQNLQRNLQFVFRKCNDDNFREILVDIRSRNIYSMIVDIRPTSLPNLLTAVCIYFSDLYIDHSFINEFIFHIYMHLSLLLSFAFCCVCSFFCCF